MLGHLNAVKENLAPRRFSARRRTGQALWLNPHSRSSPTAGYRRSAGKAPWRSDGGASSAHDAAGRPAADRARCSVSASTFPAAAISRPTTPISGRRRCSSRRTSPARCAACMVREGQHVGARRRAVRDRSRCRSSSRSKQAQSKLDTVRTEFANLKSNYSSLSQPRRAGAAERSTSRRRDVERKSALAANRGGLAGRSRQRQGGAAPARAAARSLASSSKLHAQPAARRSQSADREISRLSAGHGGARTGQRDLDHTVLQCADRRHGDPGRQHPARPFRHRRHAGVQRDRRQRALGRRQPEGNRHHLSAGRARRSTSSVDTFPDHGVPRHRQLGEPGHRRAIRDPAAAERQRQLGQGGAARAGARSPSTLARTCLCCAPA